MNKWIHSFPLNLNHSSVKAISYSESLQLVFGSDTLVKFQNVSVLI